MKKTCDYLADIVPSIEELYGKEKCTEIMNDAQLRYNELLEENKDDSKKVRMHTYDRIYPAVAMFDALTNNGVEREEAADLLVEYYHQRSEPVGEMIRKIMKVPGLYKIIPSLFTKLTNVMFGEDSGFKARYYPTGKNQMKVDMVKCPYTDLCKKYGCPEIVRGFCEADDICYGHMHEKLIWGRTKTLGKGGDCCDFDIRIKE